MPTSAKRTELEQELANLKAARQDGNLAPSEYFEQAEKLRFDDDDGQTWWLDPESESWYVAPTGSDAFKPYQAEAPPLPPPPKEDILPQEDSPLPEAVVSVPVGAETSPVAETSLSPVDVEIDSGKSSIVVEPIVSTPPLPPKRDTSSPNLPYKLIIGAAVTLLLMALAAGGLFMFSGSDTSTPTATAMASQPTFMTTPEPLPTETEVAPLGSIITTSIPLSATLLPIPTPTSTASPSPLATSTSTPITPTPTESPMPTKSPTPTETSTPTPSPSVETVIMATVNPPTSPPEPGFRGKFAYPEYDQANRTFNVRIFDLATDEEIITILQASQPALNPNGTELAYISWVGDNLGLFSLTLTDETKKPITTNLDSYRPQWSFDNRIVFKYIKPNEESVKFDDNNGIRDLKARTPVWTPDGRLVLWADKRGQSGLAVVNSDGNGLRFLTNRTDDIAPAVSPDGLTVAYTSPQSGSYDIWLININDGTPTRLTTSPYREGLPTWSPDGTWIAFVLEQEGNWTVQAIRPDGTEQQKLFDLTGSLDSKDEDQGHRQFSWLHENISWSK